MHVIMGAVQLNGLQTTVQLAGRSTATASTPAIPGIPWAPVAPLKPVLPLKPA